MATYYANYNYNAAATAAAAAAAAAATAAATMTVTAAPTITVICRMCHIWTYDAVILHPCQCQVCKDCMILYLARRCFHSQARLSSSSSYPGDCTIPCLVCSGSVQSHVSIRGVPFHHNNNNNNNTHNKQHPQRMYLNYAALAASVPAAAAAAAVPMAAATPTAAAVAASAPGGNCSNSNNNCDIAAATASRTTMTTTTIPTTSVLGNNKDDLLAEPFRNIETAVAPATAAATNATDQSTVAAATTVGLADDDDDDDATTMSSTTTTTNPYNGTTTTTTTTTALQVDQTVLETIKVHEDDHHQLHSSNNNNSSNDDDDNKPSHLLPLASTDADCAATTTDVATTTTPSRRKRASTINRKSTSLQTTKRTMTTTKRKTPPRDKNREKQARKKRQRIKLPTTTLSSNSIEQQQQQQQQQADWGDYDGNGNDNEGLLPNSSEPNEEYGARGDEEGDENGNNDGDDKEEVEPKRHSKPILNRRERVFTRRFKSLVIYHNANGHCNVLRNYEADPPLAQWVADLKLGRLLVKEQEKGQLDAIGFDWDPDTLYDNELCPPPDGYKRFEDHFQELVQHVAQHGWWFNSNCALLKPIKSWMSFLRRRKIFLKPEQIAQLDALGFEWGVETYSRRKSFEDRILELEAYKARHGHIHVPYDSDSPSLSEWVKGIRRGLLKVTLEQRLRLTQMGFLWETVWNRKDRQWKERYSQIKQFFATHGHFRVPEKENKSLYEWYHTQKKMNNKGQLRQDRRAMLIELGLISQEPCAVL